MIFVFLAHFAYLSRFGEERLIKSFNDVKKLLFLKILIKH